MVRIAVEEPFVSVKDALEKKGYNAEMLKDKTDSVDYDCVVVRDMQSLADFHMNVPLVEAHGRTLYEIVEEVEERLVRSGKIPAPHVYEDNESGGSSFVKGIVTGAVVGAAAGLLLAPKSGKEMQATLKDKSAGPKGKLSDTVGQVKEKTSGVTEKAKGKVDELKAKREEKKEDKELKKQEKEVIKEAKAEEKAEEKAKKEHEKAEKQAEKEIKKAEKDAKQESGGIEVVEFGESDVTTAGSGSAVITPKDSNKK